MSLQDKPLVKPVDALARARLFELAQRDRCDTELLRDILWLISAHCHLLALPKAVGMVQDILAKAPDNWQRTIKELGLQEWRPLLRWITDNEERLGKSIGIDFNTRHTASGANPILGSGAPTFPLYTCLCETPPPGNHRRPFIELVGQFLLAHVNATRITATRSDYEDGSPAPNWKLLPNGSNPAALAVRRLSESPHLSQLLKMPVQLAPVDFVSELEDLPEPANELLARDQRQLFSFLQKAWEITDWHGSGRGGTDGGVGHAWVGGRWSFEAALSIEPTPIGDETDPFSNWGKLSTVRPSIQSSRQVRALQASDLPEDEDDLDEDIVLSGFDCATGKRDLGSLAQVARAKAKHIAMHNQLLPWTYTGLAVQEIAQLVAALRKSFNAIGRKPRAEHLVTFETLFALHCMLWTGSDAQRIASIEWADSSSDEQNAALALDMIGDGNVKLLRWRIRALTPHYETELHGNPDQLRACQPMLELPDHIGLWPYVDALLKANPALEKGGQLLTQSASTLTTEIGRWLCNNLPDGRVTITKLVNTLWNRLYAEIGDSTLASCITGNMHPLARVRLFYSTPNSDVLRRHYKHAIDQLSSQLYSALNKEKIQVPVRLNDVSKFAALGARLCPTIAAVQHLFQRLGRDIKIAATYTDRPGFIQYHNLLTLYTAQYFAYATTCRAIITPYLPLQRIDLERGITWLSDKDDERHHKTRLIWINPALLEHMTRYACHIETVRSQLDQQKVAASEPIFFLTETFRPELVRPKSIEPRLVHYLEVLANTHRRFLRTQLIERGCPPEVVDAFMGHWQQGEEPFGPYSNFSYGRFVQTLREYLLPLLADIGLPQTVPMRLAS